MMAYQIFLREVSIFVLSGDGHREENGKLCSANQVAGNRKLCSFHIFFGSVSGR